MFVQTLEDAREKGVREIGGMERDGGGGIG